LVVDIGSAVVDLSSGSGTTAASFDITFSNPMAMPELLSGYSIFLDISPLGRQLPLGVTFGTPEAEYPPAGSPPLFGTGGIGTVNPTPAAGDLGLGQFQLFNGTIEPGQSFQMVTVNLMIDRDVAAPGVFDLVLSPDGQNVLNELDMAMPVAKPFTVSPGTLTITAVPEPGSSAFAVSIAAMGVAVYRRRSRLKKKTDSPASTA
jgi:hypothetical protein